MATNIHTDDQHASSHQDGGADELSLASLSGTPAALATHAADIDAHAFDIRQIMRVDRYHTEFGSFASGDEGCPGADKLSASPFTIARTLTINRLHIITVQAGGAGKSARLGIYYDDGDGYPGALLTDAGEVDIEDAASKYIDLDPTIQLTKGLYWLCIICEAECRPRYRFWNTHWSPIGAHGGGYITYLCWTKAQAYGALPDPFPSGATADGHPVGIALRVASLD